MLQPGSRSATVSVHLEDKAVVSLTTSKETQVQLNCYSHRRKFLNCRKIYTTGVAGPVHDEATTFPHISITFF